MKPPCGFNECCKREAIRFSEYREREAIPLWSFSAFRDREAIRPWGFGEFWDCGKK